MKTLIVLITMVSASFAQADAQMRAERAFQQMDKYEAQDSNLFDTRVWNIHMPGTNTWFKPSTSLCMEGSSVVRTVKKISKCTLWSAKDDGKTRTFKTRSRAEDWGNNVKCVQKTQPQFISTPVNYTKNACVAWLGKNRDGDEKVFSNRSQADRFDKNDSADCVEYGLVAKKMPTTYKMEFYRNVASQDYDSDTYIGSHIYPITQCDE